MLLCLFFRVFSFAPKLTSLASSKKVTFAVSLYMLVAVHAIKKRTRESGGLCYTGCTKKKRGKTKLFRQSATSFTQRLNYKCVSYLWKVPAQVKTNDANAKFIKTHGYHGYASSAPT